MTSEFDFVTKGKHRVHMPQDPWVPIPESGLTKRGNSHTPPSLKGATASCLSALSHRTGKVPVFYSNSEEGPPNLHGIMKIVLTSCRDLKTILTDAQLANLEIKSVFS